MNYKENDVVQLLIDVPNEGLKTGAIGVVVAEFIEPEEAYEIEFSDEVGKTIAQLALLPNQIALLKET